MHVMYECMGACMYVYLYALTNAYTFTYCTYLLQRP